MKSLIIGSQHGNELLGEKLYRYICRHYKSLKDNVDFYLANPKARALATRCIETDMNQSYVKTPISYEERRAEELLKKIQLSNYDLVLDCHTTTAIEAPCIIMYHSSDSVKRFVNASSLQIVVQMADKPAEKSLIGNVHSALSLEIAEHDLNDSVLESLCQDVDRFIQGKRAVHQRQYFRVERRLLKSEVSNKEKASLKNFKKSRLGFYPMLVGEVAYEEHTDTLGFRVQKVNKGRL